MHSGKYDKYDRDSIDTFTNRLDKFKNSEVDIFKNSEVRGGYVYRSYLLYAYLPLVDSLCSYENI